MPATKAVSKIEMVSLSKIDANPCRLLKKYPFIDNKLEALERSMKEPEIGCWEGIIARAATDDGRYEIAFGHHRVQAAKNIGLKEIPLIVRQLDDREMLQFMGRENLDDYAASFMVLLETWEAAEKYVEKDLEPVHRHSVQVIEIARLLGWVISRGGSRSGEQTMTNTAKACNAAHKLIVGGHLARETLDGLTMNEAREIVERAHFRVEELSRMASEKKRPHAEVAKAKSHVAKAVKETAREVKAGKVANRDIRSRVDLNAYIHAKKSKKVSPLFDSFGKAVAESISKMINDDAASVKLKAIAEALGKIELDQDHQTVARILFELERLGERSEKWHGRLSKKPATVTALKLLKGSV
jgi:ParB family chromosome partitioning protein